MVVGGVLGDRGCVWRCGRLAEVVEVAQWGIMGCFGMRGWMVCGCGVFVHKCIEAVALLGCAVLMTGSGGGGATANGSRW